MYFDKDNQSLLIASGFFSVGVVLLIIFSIGFDFSDTNLGVLLFLMTFVTMILLSKIIYDAHRTHTEDTKFSTTFLEESTLESHELYTELYNNSPVPYVLINYSGEVLSANVAARRFFGFKAGAEVGFNVLKTMSAEQPDHLDFLFEKYKNKISISDEMLKIQQLDGREAWALVSLFQFNARTGEHLGLLTLVDITRQKRVESAKTEFVSLASHQLRTPISAIKWSAELLQLDQSGNLTDRQKKYIDRLLSGAKRMSILVDDFLRVSRFELGTFQPEYKELNLEEMFAGVINEQSGRAAAKNLITNTFFDSSIRAIITDPSLVRMVVSNVYSNAIKYSRLDGTIQVTSKHKGQDLEITVTDAGIGIPIAEQERIFTKLFRASNAVRDIPDGTGLGLYIAKQAVDVLKGKISFHSVENSNTTFSVVLPLKLAHNGRTSHLDDESLSPVNH